MPSLLPAEGMEGGGFLSTGSQEGPPEGPTSHFDILGEASDGWKTPFSPTH